MQKKLGVMAVALMLTTVMVVLTACGGYNTPRNGEYVITSASARTMIMEGATMSEFRAEMREELVEDMYEGGHIDSKDVTNAVLIAAIRKQNEAMLEAIQPGQPEYDFISMYSDINWDRIGNSWNRFVDAYLDAYVTFLQESILIKVEDNMLTLDVPMFGASVELPFEMDGRNVIFTGTEGEAMMEVMKEEEMSLTFRNSRFTLTFQAEDYRATSDWTDEQWEQVMAGELEMPMTTRTLHFRR